jgi:predicted nucleotide-binding protein
MIQGAADNDLWLIVSGAVSIRINGREVATRQAGTHVGEMALIEALSKRSASVLTLEPTITLKLSEPVFSRLAKTTPELWRRVAAEIATRLRERSKFVRAPNNQPVLFLGSSTEGLTVAETLNDRFRKQPVVSRLWTLGVFQPSSTAIESLVKIAGLADFAIFVLTADDVTFSRRKKQQSPRLIADRTSWFSDNFGSQAGAMTVTVPLDPRYLSAPSSTYRIPPLAGFTDGATEAL